MLGWCGVRPAPSLLLGLVFKRESLSKRSNSKARRATVVEIDVQRLKLVLAFNNTYSINNKQEQSLIKAHMP
jgi:hypothetical protein